MICTICGTKKAYENRFDIVDASAKVKEMLQTFPLSRSPHSSAIPQMLSDAEADSRQYEAEIAQLHSLMLFLRTKQQSVEKQMEHLKSLTSPIRRLPVEILTEIFLIVCEGKKVVFSHYRRHIQTPFALASVCSGWRKVVMGISGSWARFCIVSCDRDRDSMVPSDLTSSLSLCLARSKSSPLSVRVVGAPNTLFNRLAELSSQWEELEAVADVSRYPGP
jgi:hypothetical protein